MFSVYQCRLGYVGVVHMVMHLRPACGSRAACFDPHTQSLAASHLCTNATDPQRPADFLTLLGGSSTVVEGSNSGYGRAAGAECSSRQRQVSLPVDLEATLALLYLD